MHHILRTTLTAMTLWLGCTATATAQTYPAQPIRLIAPFPPGGFTDVVIRKAAAGLSRELGTTVLVENKPGAGTNIGTDTVVKSAADGYTLLVGTSSLAINPSLYAQLPFDPQRDLRPIGMLATTGYTLIANKDFQPPSTQTLIEYAKSHPGQISFGSSGNGAVNHLAAVLFSSSAGVDMLHVPYRGSQAAIADLIGGRIQLFWSSTLEALPLIQSGRVKAFGVTDPDSVSALPDVPPIGQTLKSYEVKYWMGLFAPAAVSDVITQQLAAALERVAQDPELLAYLKQSGANSAFLPPDKAAELLSNDTQRWAGIVKASGAKVE